MCCYQNLSYYIALAVVLGLDLGGAAIREVHECTCRHCGATFQSMFPIVLHHISLIECMYGTKMVFVFIASIETATN